MKRLLTLCLCILLCFQFSACSTKTQSNSESIKKFISKHIGIDVSAGVQKEYNDDHGGFLGDGTTYSEYSFESNDLLEQIKKNDKWKSFPLTSNLHTVVYGGEYFDIELNTMVNMAPHISNEEGEAILPEIKNGYYYFYDRHSENSNDRYDDSELLSRYSVNYTLGIYDCDTNTLYFFAMDT